VGAAYAVLDLQGSVVTQGRVSAADFGLDMPRASTYLVRIGSEVKKIAVK
jgi:hypothetical protein